jgi:DNA repair protein RadD
LRLELRKYQIEAIHAIRAAYQSGRRAPLFVLPTGGGKTVIFCAIAELMEARGKKITILVHRDHLIEQAHRQLELLGIRHGVIAAGYTPDTRRNVQIASVYTLTRRAEKMNPPDLYIIDEAHHARAKTWSRILDAHRRSRILGVTATPCRTDGSGLGIESGGHFDSLIEGPTIPELTRFGYLAPFDYYQPPAGINLSNVRITAGDFNSRDLAAAVNKSTITGCAIEHYNRIAPHSKAVAFCVSVEHAQQVAFNFAKAGHPAAAIHSGLEREQIRSTIKALEAGRLSILTSCDLISEGFDLPAVQTAILLRPTHSTGLFLQQTGRVLRPAPGKTAIILDHAGNASRHGLPDDPRSWTLEAETKKAKKGENADEPPALKQCDLCYTVHRPAPACPRCGFVYQTNGRKLEAVDGQLAKVDREAAKAAAEVERLNKSKELRSARTLEELKKIAAARGYSKAWAYKIHSARERRA